MLYSIRQRIKCNTEECEMLKATIWKDKKEQLDYKLFGPLKFLTIPKDSWLEKTIVQPPTCWPINILHWKLRPVFSLLKILLNKLSFCKNLPPSHWERRKEKTVIRSQNCKCQLAVVPNKESCSLYSRNSNCPKYSTSHLLVLAAMYT